MATAGLEAVGDHRLPMGIRAGSIYEASIKFGSLMSRIRPLPHTRFAKEAISQSKFVLNSITHKKATATSRYMISMAHERTPSK